MGIFKKLFSSKVQPKVELILDENGWYVVRAWGTYLTDTLTKDKEIADRHFQEVKNHNKTARKFTVIQSDIIPD